MTISNYLILLSVIVNLTFAIYILLKGKYRLVNIVYGIGNIFIALYSLSILVYCYLFQIQEYLDLTIYLAKFAYASVLFIGLAFFLFTNIFPYQLRKINYKGLIIFSVVIFIYSYIIIFTDYFLQEINFSTELNERVVLFGSQYFVLSYELLLLILYCYCFYNLYSNLRKSQGIIKLQILYVLVGSIVTVFLTMFIDILIILFKWYSIEFLEPLATLIMVFASALAIIKYNLMDLKLVLRKSTVYFFSLITIILVIFFIVYCLNFLFPENIIFFIIISMLLTIFSFIPLRNYYFKIANKYFFTSLYDSNNLINKISKELQTTLDEEKIYNILYQNLVNAFHCKSFTVVLVDFKRNKMIIKFKRGFENVHQKIFDRNKQLINLLKNKYKPIIIEELKESHNNKNFNRLIDFFTAYNVNLILPLIIQNKNIGSIVLGPKESGDIYNDEDITVLNIIGSQVGMSLENAKLYKELQEKNKHLRKLLAMRSEFLDIASHQLRTPVSIIRGSLSMMKEQDGLDSLKKKELLENSIRKSVKLKEVINDILDASELDTDKKFTIEEKKVNLKNLLIKIYNEKKIEAQDKGLELKLYLPEKNLPPIYTEERHFKQIIDILINNALQYSAKGSIKISAFQKDNHVYIDVSDTGIGIPSNDEKNLFKKFERASNAMSIYTDGSGLGLFIAKKIINAHKNASIYIKETKLNKGTTFEIKMPIKTKK